MVSNDFLFHSFDLQLEDWGVDLEALKARKVERIFRVWVEDWELECINVNDSVLLGPI